MNEKSSNRRIVAETPKDANCFIGFHDIIPWSADGSCLAVHRAAPGYYQMSDTDKEIDICLWRPDDGTLEAVDRTNAWNFQQGARLQWLPGHPDTLVFNAVENGKLAGILRNVKTGERRALSSPIYVFTPDGKKSYAPNFVTLAHRWKAYGYASVIGTPDSSDPSADGIWETDVETDTSRLFVSTQRAADFEAVPNADPASHFLCHPSVSPDGSKVIFLHRFFSADGGLFTRLIVTDREAKVLTLLGQEKVSHSDWIDNDTILVWARFASGELAKARASGVLSSPLIRPLLRIARSFKGQWKKNLLSEAYYLIRVDAPKDRRRYGWPKLDNDGHPMVGRSHRWIVTDTYPDSADNLPVILYNQDTGERIDVAVFTHKSRSDDTDVKCDLHPRWNRDESLVAVDTCEAGYRQVRILNVRDVVRASSK